MSSDYYNSYINSAHWRRFRKKAIAHYGRICSSCTQTDLPECHVHHLTYERLGHELLEDVAIMCPACHNRKHGRKLRDTGISHQKYFASEEWKALQNAVLRHYNYTCSSCGTKEQTIVRHTTSRLVGQATPDDLFVTCRLCLNGPEDEEAPPKRKERKPVSVAKKARKVRGIRPKSYTEKLEQSIRQARVPAIVETSDFRSKLLGNEFEAPEPAFKIRRHWNPTKPQKALIVAAKRRVCVSPEAPYVPRTR